MASLTTLPSVCGSNCSPNNSSASSCLNFPFWKLHKTMATSGAVMWQESWYGAMFVPLTRLLCACSSVTQQHFYDSTPVPAEFIVSSLKCCLGVLLGGSVLSPFILFCGSSNIHFMPSVRASTGCGDHGWSYSACCKFPSGEMMDPPAITQRGQGWMESGRWWQTDLYKNWGGIVWAAGSRPPFIKPLILQAINYSG